MAKHPSYHYVTHKETDEQGYRVAEGKYAGVVWLYRNVKLPMYNDNDELVNLESAEQLPLSFEYHILHNPTDEDLDTGELSATIGDILLNIIDESIENDQLQFKNRNDDTQ